MNPRIIFRAKPELNRLNAKCVAYFSLLSQNKQIWMINLSYLRVHSGLKISGRKEEHLNILKHLAVTTTGVCFGKDRKERSVSQTEQNSIPEMSNCTHN